VQRRDALQRAIELSRSSHAPLKRLAAVNVAKFFKAFPDLEEDAINAIYDLCEDQDQNVRIMLPRFSTPGVDPHLFLFSDSDSRIQCCRADVQGTAGMGREERGCARAVTSKR
jgi:hypothetical protein